MKSSTALLPGLLLALGLAVPSIARADIPPSPGYVETCTVENEQRPGEECVLCGDAYHGERDACEKQHGPAGYARRCRTAGASVWKEVWCKQSAAAAGPPVAAGDAGGAKTGGSQSSGEAKPAAPAAKAGGCSVGGAGAGGWSLLVLGLALAGVRRRARA